MKTAFSVKFVKVIRATFFTSLSKKKKIMDYRYASHTIFKIEYYFVFVTKYWYEVLKGVVESYFNDLLYTSKKLNR